MLNAETIANKARKAISKFCFEECNAYCCRKGYLVLTKEELQIIKGKHQLITEAFKKGKYSLFLGNTCPALKPDFKCKIHKNLLRPLACKQFPIFVQKKTIMLSGRCLAVKQDKLYPFIKQWLTLGYKIYISEGNEGWDLEKNNPAPKNI